MLLPTEIPREVGHLCSIVKDPGAFASNVAALSVLTGAHLSLKDSSGWHAKAKQAPERRPEPAFESAPCSEALVNARELLSGFGDGDTDECRAWLVKKFAGIN